MFQEREFIQGIHTIPAAKEARKLSTFLHHIVINAQQHHLILEVSILQHRESGVQISRIPSIINAVADLDPVLGDVVGDHGARPRGLRPLDKVFKLLASSQASAGRTEQSSSKSSKKCLQALLSNSGELQTEDARISHSASQRWNSSVSC